MESSSDKLLWQQIRLGNAKAFQTLYEKYIDDLILFGKKICKDDNLIQDTLQLFFLQLWEKRSKLSLPNHSKAYLIMSLRNNLIRAIKKEQIISEVDIEEHLRDTPILSIGLDDQDDAQKLQSAIHKLPARQQEILHLRYYQNIRNQEIAEIMGISYQSVSNLLQRAIKQIKPHIQREEE